MLCAAVCAARVGAWWTGNSVGVTWAGRGLPSGDNHAIGLVTLRMGYVSVTQRGVIHAGRFNELMSSMFADSMPADGWSAVPVSDVSGDDFGLKRDGSGETLLLPAWVVAILLGFLPLWWVKSFRRDRRRSKRRDAGQCLACGYDLRESPERCPECGAAVGGEYPRSGSSAVGVSGGT